MASEVKGRVDAELAQIKTVRAAFDELLASLKPHRKNMARVRAWRLNIRSNIERLSEPHKARLNEDTVNQLIALQQRMNSALNMLDDTVNSEAEAQEWLAEYQRYVGVRRAIRDNDAAGKQQRWSAELEAIVESAAQGKNQVRQYTQALEAANKKRRGLEDAYTRIAQLISAVNGTIAGLNGTIDSLNATRQWQQRLDEYRGARERLERATDAWSSQIAGVNRQVEQASELVAQYANQARNATTIERFPDDDKRVELEQSLRNRLETSDDFNLLRVATDRQRMLVYATPLNEDGLSTFGVADCIDVFNDVVDEYEDGDIPDIELDRRVKEAQGQIAGFLGAGIATAIVNAGYFPANPAGQQLQRLEYTDADVMRAALQQAQQMAGKYPAQSYAVQQRRANEVEPVQIALTARLSAPKRPNDELAVKPVKVAISARLSRPVVNYEDDKRLPQNVADELESYTHGKFDNTINHADEINAYHNQYGTLALEIEQNSTASDDVIATAQQAVNELEAMIESFTGEFNSSTGKAVVSALKSATSALESATNKQAVAVSNAIADFEAAETNLTNWLQNNWYQFGGTPQNHKASFSGDKVTYVNTPKSALSKSDL